MDCVQVEQLLVGREKNRQQQQQQQRNTGILPPFDFAQGQNDDVKQMKPTAEANLLLILETGH